MTAPTPIQTVYKGYRFRSRLEARWAVWLDHIGVPWRYEHEGYDLGNAGPYLPDFLIPANEQAHIPAYFIEVKPDSPSPDELEKAAALALATGQWVNFFIGSPGHRDHKVIAIRSRKPEHLNPTLLAQFEPYLSMAMERGDALAAEALMSSHKNIYWGEWAQRFLALHPDTDRFARTRLENIIRRDRFFSQARLPALCPSCGALHFSYASTEVPEMGYINGADGMPYQYCVGFERSPEAEYDCQGCDEFCDADSERIKAAYLAARGARFEHGERP